MEPWDELWLHISTYNLQDAPLQIVERCEAAHRRKMLEQVPAWIADFSQSMDELGRQATQVGKELGRLFETFTRSINH